VVHILAKMKIMMYRLRLILFLKKRLREHVIGAPKTNDT
jgi:hypothetical protein